ncbi:SusC/RagA family TonB-linked outer membrane protein [Hymenobacter chitinivorans]|uniref:TonB-linked SusC/RagA family outer membrane protein n=1 Tax=Hymenobacter chitinivorans DSM 11115 TaxID=1121954 RepID=A0A2M9BLE9_9BACT|nr:TonB-dependent receptor [Hymenobacter chitinivorans]PJJ58745.1 TonB-linked SusC/RagA family outer membrane protein [Hymenobacter chitinivorans DSM 11115]
MRKHLLFLWLLLSVALHAVAQQRSIQGVVRSTEKDEPLPGVTVVVKGTTNGASTDQDGKFSISLPAATKDVVLRLSYIGFISKDVPVGDKSTVNVQLSPDTKVMEDVVVIGYAAVNRRDVTGSVSSVSAQQIKDVPVNSAAEALSGRLAGVQVTASEGQPGSDIRIRVRGGGSITQDNSPLYVVDGVQLENALSVISPQDIQSVDVLKDAAATAIYGARGANGVVIITTKGGREGKTTVAYTGFAGFRRITKTLDVLQPADYIDYAYEKSRISGADQVRSFRNRFGSSTFRDTRDYSTIQGYDTLGALRNSEFINWQDKVFGRDAFQQTHNISVSGGAKGTTYSLSVTRNDEDGIQLNSGFTRNLVNFRFDHKANDKFRIGFSTRLTDQAVTGAGTSAAGTGSTTNSRLRNTLVYQPLATPNQLAAGVSIDDNPDDDFFNSSGSLSNPVLTVNNEYRKDLRRVFNFSGNAAYSILKNLTLRSVLGFDNTYTRGELFYGQYSPNTNNFAKLPYVQIGTGQNVTINQSNTLAYNFKKDKHAFDALIGEEVYTRKNVFLNVASYYLPQTITAQRALDNISQRDPSAPSTPQPAPTSGISENSRLLSAFGRLNYSYNERYLLTATFRADGSSKFKSPNKVGYFPAVSLAWRISQEEFMEPYAATVSDLKLRLSYGLSGNNRIADFLYDPLFSTGNNGNNYALNDVIVPGAAAVSLANPNLKWETTASTNVGFDLSLFNNRVQFTADAYYNKTRDLLLNLAIPATTGYTSQLINVGSTSNRGVELQLSGTALQTPDFTWTANANLSFNRNRVESLGGGDALPLQYSGWASTAIAADYFVGVGQPVGLMYGYVTDFETGNKKGFYDADDFTGYVNGQWVLKQGVASDRGVTGFSAAGQQVTPGTIKLKDINGDGVVDANDRTVIGNANPKFTGGLNQQFTYKQFDASIFLNFVYGNDVYNANKIELTSYLANTQLSNGLAVMKDRYRQIDENGALITDLESTRRVNQNASIWTPTRTLFPHSWAIEDGSFLRINNLTLGYTLPKTVSGYAKLSQARFYVTLNNLYTFTKYTGYDPEVNTRRSTPLTPGVDYAAYPRSRAFLAGLNLTF